VNWSLAEIADRRTSAPHQISLKGRNLHVWPHVTVGEATCGSTSPPCVGPRGRAIGSQVCDHYRRARLRLCGADLSVECARTAVDGAIFDGGSEDDGSEYPLHGTVLGKMRVLHPQFLTGIHKTPRDHSIDGD
jgi:hypothetical protein